MSTKTDNDLADTLRLARAAPQLLAACKEARRCLLNLMPETGPMQRQMQKAVGELSAAIAAATPPER